DLLAALRQGEFCYVLTSRQMGKSSLMARTAARLKEEGCAVVVLDLTAIGQNLAPEQWYDGLLNLVGRQLNLEDELDDFWLSHPRWGPSKRWMAALEKVVQKGSDKWKVKSNKESASTCHLSFATCHSRLVIFIDEIDAVRSLPFSTDEFFAGIRQCYN